MLALLVPAISGLEPFGADVSPYGTVVAQTAPEERQVRNVVTAIVFDHRGFDTLGEECILFAAVLGVLLVLRKQEVTPGGQGRHGLTPHPSEALHGVAAPLAAVPLVLGAYFVLTGHTGVGGGFQGGALLASGWAVTALVAGSDAYARATPLVATERVEAAAIAAYVLTGLLGLACGRPFLTNVLPLGVRGELASSGTVVVLDVAVGVAVAAGFALVTLEFLRPLGHLAPRRQQ
jgi:multicomponent Na+:H+ antiporter subunit B